MTIAALLCGLIGCGANDGETALLELAPGDCVDIDPLGTDERFTSVPVVGCDEPHYGEVFFVGDLNPDDDQPYPPDDELFAAIDQICIERFVTYPDPSVDPREMRNFPIAPDEETWEGADGRYVCIAMRRDAERFVGALTESS